jgi:hypothetical protein
MRVQEVMFSAGSSEPEDYTVLVTRLREEELPV